MRSLLAYQMWKQRSTVQLLKEQKKYDQMLSSPYDRVQQMFPLAKQVADEIVKELIPRMFETVYRAAKVAFNYLKCGG